MDPDCQVTVKGLPEPDARNTGEALCAVVRTLAQAKVPLDLRRMRRIVVTTDFRGELAELSASTASGNPIAYTDEEYAIAVAKVLTLPRGGECEIVLVIDARVAASLGQEEQQSHDAEDLQVVLHLLHHELCHVHDRNKMIDAFPGLVLRGSYRGKESIVGPLAETCWSEYIADVMSASTASKGWVAAMAGAFEDALSRTKQVVDGEIIAYRRHHDVNRLLQVFQRHGEFLVTMAAHMLGYTDGLEVPLSALSVTAAQRLSGSYFEATWHAMHEALKGMRAIYPEGWSELSVYSALTGVLGEYYTAMGLVLSTVGNGQIYVRVPFRPETMPAP